MPHAKSYPWENTHLVQEDTGEKCVVELPQLRVIDRVLHSLLQLWQADRRRLPQLAKCGHKLHYC